MCYVYNMKTQIFFSEPVPFGVMTDIAYKVGQVFNTIKTQSFFCKVNKFYIEGNKKSYIYLYFVRWIQYAMDPDQWINDHVETIDI